MRSAGFRHTDDSGFEYRYPLFRHFSFIVNSVVNSCLFVVIMLLFKKVLSSTDITSSIAILIAFISTAALCYHVLPYACDCTVEEP